MGRAARRRHDHRSRQLCLEQYARALRGRGRLQPPRGTQRTWRRVVQRRPIQPDHAAHRRLQLLRPRRGHHSARGQADDLELPNIFYAGNTTTIAPFLTSSPIFSWLERDADAETRDDDEPTGPLAIGVTIDAAGPYGVEPTPGAPRTKIVVIGDSDFASNRFFSSFSNGDVLLNSVNWLTGDVDLISVRRSCGTPACSS